MDNRVKELLDMAQNIQSFIEERCSDDPNKLVAKLTEINSYIAISGKMLSDAKYLQDEYMVLVFNSNMEKIQQLSPSVANKYVYALCKDVNYLVNWAERINRSLVHIGDNIRTQVSFAKEEMSLTRKGY